jgi:hypothetical protein
MTLYSCATMQQVLLKTEILNFNPRPPALLNRITSFCCALEQCVLLVDDVTVGIALCAVVVVDVLHWLRSGARK